MQFYWANFLIWPTAARHFAALWLAANTGMRRGEVLGLRWGDVDLGAARALGQPLACLGRL